MEINPNPTPEGRPMEAPTKNWCRNLLRVQEAHDGSFLLVAERLQGVELPEPQVVAWADTQADVDFAAAAFAVSFGNTEVAA